MPLTIDAHHHYWELGRFAYDWLQADALASIRRDYLPSDLQPLLSQSGVDRTVFGIDGKGRAAEHQFDAVVIQIGGEGFKELRA